MKEGGGDGDGQNWSKVEKSSRTRGSVLRGGVPESTPGVNGMAVPEGWPWCVWAEIFLEVAFARVLSVLILLY